MARDATARLYDVDEDALTFKRLRVANKYDQGLITFQAKRGGLVDLEKLHESIWATRLSGGTSSGVICLEVTAAGEVVVNNGETILTVSPDDRQFVLVDDVSAKPEGAKSAMKDLRDTLDKGERIVSVTGYVDGWVGRWPNVLREPPAKRPRLMVTSFETEKN